jgi:hypothetical protein
VKATGSPPARRRSGDQLRGKAKTRKRQTKETSPPRNKSAQKHENKPGLQSPFLLKPTGTLSRHHLAHFVSAVDTFPKIISGRNGLRRRPTLQHVFRDGRLGDLKAEHNLATERLLLPAANTRSSRDRMPSRACTGCGRTPTTGGCNRCLRIALSVMRAASARESMNELKIDNTPFPPSENMDSRWSFPSQMNFVMIACFSIYSRRLADSIAA